MTSSSSLKVLHVIPSLAAVHGGPSAALPAMERALAAAGVEVETATTNDDGPERRLSPPPPSVFNGVRRHYFPRQTQFYSVSAPFSRWIARHVRDYDLVHIHALFSHLSTAAALAARRARVPYILRPCGTLTEYGMRVKPVMKRISLALFEGRAIRDAAAIHCTSGTERDEALRIGLPMRPVVLPLGVELPPAGDADRFLARHPEMRGGPRLLFLSRLHPKKNLEALIDALPQLGVDAGGPLLIVCGSGARDYEAALRERARAQGVAERIAWAGFLSGTDKADALAAADIFVLPSFSENFGVAAVEALAAGLPCVVGQGVAISAEIEAAGAGMAVAPDARSLGRALREILALDDRAALADAARRLAAERYTTDAMGASLITLYREITSGRMSERTR